MDRLYTLLCAHELQFNSETRFSDAGDLIRRTVVSLGKVDEPQGGIIKHHSLTLC